jgi:poly-gamma-glutamate capsule biosynthesis protein CapA/YwtB (metallophosphatase superfamily)
MAESVTLLAVGDLVPSRPFAAGTTPSPDFAATMRQIQSADIAFGDLEMPLSSTGHPKEKLIAFHAAPELVDDLAATGFTILSLANNHSLDYGHDALFDTMAGLDRVGIRHLGAGQTLDEALAPVIIDTNGLKIGVLAFTALLPTGAAASPRRPGLAPIHVHVAYEVNPYVEMEEPGNPPRVKTWADPDDLAAFASAMRDVRPQVDVLAISAHWGYGAGELLAEYQRPLGHALIDAGADVILGNHVHAVHGVEVYQGKPILYSPGNFIAQQPRDGLSDFAIQILDEMSTDGYMAWVELTSDGAAQIRLTPTVTNAEGLPVAAEGDDFERITQRLVRLSAQLDTRLQIAGDQVVVEFGS